MKHSTPPSPLPLADIPDFRLIKPIGSGSYGEVWLARSVTGAYRAIKIVRRDQFDCENSFEREFRGIEAFEPVSRTHGNLLQVLHVGRNATAGFYFYVMELADDTAGVPVSNPDAYSPKTLRSLVRAGDRLPVFEVIRIGRELASGLSHLHGLGLVHRDIKPSNIVFVGGVAKLGDAGLVAHTSADLSIVGTEGYVPPEGMGRPPADLYSLGMVLYEISSGRCRQDYPEIPTDLPSREDKSLFMQLNAVVLKACDPIPTRRFKTASQLLAALERIKPNINGEDKVHSLFGKKRLFWTAIIALILLLVLLFSGFAQSKRRMAIRQERPETTLVPSAVPSLSITADNEIDNPTHLEPTKAPILTTEGDSPAAVSGDNGLRIHNPVPVKTITTENADEFLQP